MCDIKMMLSSQNEVFFFILLETTHEEKSKNMKLVGRKFVDKVILLNGESSPLLPFPPVVTARYRQHSQTASSGTNVGATKERGKIISGN